MTVGSKMQCLKEFKDRKRSNLSLLPGYKYSVSEKSYKIQICISHFTLHIFFNGKISTSTRQVGGIFLNSTVFHAEGAYHSVAL